MTALDSIWYKISVTLLAAGFAVAASIGAYGGWNTGDSNDNSVQTGIVDLAPGASTLAMPFGTHNDPVGPGAQGARFIMLSVPSSGPYLDLANVRVHAGVTVTSDTNLAAPDTTPPPPPKSPRTSASTYRPAQCPGKDPGPRPAAAPALSTPSPGSSATSRSRSWSASSRPAP